MHTENNMSYLPTDEQMVIWDDFRQEYPGAYQKINTIAKQDTPSGLVARDFRRQIVTDSSRPAQLWLDVALAYAYA